MGRALSDTKLSTPLMTQADRRCVCAPVIALRRLEQV